MHLPAGELERLEDGQHLLDARDGGQRLGQELVLVADDADDGAQLAFADVRLEAQLPDALQDVVDLGISRIGTEYDDHGFRGGETPGWRPPRTTGGKSLF